ncbi:acyl-CoA dehydrogenase [Nocardioides sp. J2M5]|uniref:acyl-CoA dehydrogenase family protein n=1 Tax=Nocardioides palaemonis TaxID=2829810 RepID=UPI001BA496E0|nr:acyl-CoA dehydrogenase family protein [Nocardioides palaemonis]MBS2938455.1 acyl-CoA dehydrogenase [Nocardioides palaemonis]
MPDRGAVLIGEPTDDDLEELDDLVDRAREAATDVPAALDLARAVGTQLPTPGSGRTAHLWSALASVAAIDLTVARALEPHLDALAILGQAGRSAPSGTWGVFAAEGPGEPLRAEPAGEGHVLHGRKHWCSLGGVLDRALVSAWVGEERQLFAVDLTQPGATAVPGTWVGRGLTEVDSGPVDFVGATAEAVGGPGWYLERPGFAWGGIGVAAVWFGGAVGVARRMLRAAGSRLPDQVALVHLGAVDAALHAAGCVLARAAEDVDADRLSGADGWRAALRVREVVALAAEDVLTRAAHALGPGPLATEEDHARRVADLGLYLRQWHAERDQAALGTELLRHGARGW